MAHFHCGFTNFNSLLSIEYEEINLLAATSALKESKKGELG
jgi:hypothetical protein